MIFSLCVFDCAAGAHLSCYAMLRFNENADGNYRQESEGAPPMSCLPAIPTA